MKIRMYVRTNKVGSDVEDVFEIDDEELEGMDEKEREDYISEIVSDWKDNYMDWGWEEI